MNKSDPQTPSYLLHESPGYHLTIASRVNERNLERALSRFGLTRVTWCVMLAIAVEHLSQPTEIAKFVGIDRTSLSRALRGMEADGLIERTHDSDDARRIIVELTEEGVERIEGAIPAVKSANQQSLSPLTADERRTLLQLLRRLKPGSPALTRL